MPRFVIYEVQEEITWRKFRHEVEAASAADAVAAVEGGDFAYLVTRRTPDGASVEYGVHAFGPTAKQFAARVAQRIREWATDQRHGPGPRIDAYPASTPLEELPGELVITKRHTCLTFSWPDPTASGAAG